MQQNKTKQNKKLWFCKTRKLLVGEESRQKNIQTEYQKKRKNKAYFNNIFRNKRRLESKG